MPLPRHEYDALNYHEREAKALRDRAALTEARDALNHAVHCIGRVIGNDEAGVVGLQAMAGQVAEKLAQEKIRG